MKRLRSVCVLSLFFLSCIVGLGDRQVRAAGPASPTVSIARIPALNGTVLPTDVNGDGIGDLVGLAADSHRNVGGIAIATGKGDGTFNQAVVSNPDPDRVLAIGDFNGDSKPDIVVHDGGALAVLSGDGTVNYYNAWTVAALDVTNAVALDMNNDLNVDLVAITDGAAYVFPGHGDFTFGTPTKLATSAGPSGVAAYDINNDGLPDIVVANHDAHSVSVFLNQGGLSFTASEIPLDRQANDVALDDLNHDYNWDLVVATSDSDEDNPDAYADGYVYVMFGNGDGTFKAPVKYQTAPGAWRVLVGDFNRDGVADVATANRSAIYVDDCTTSLKTWDSVTILSGNSVGDGTFGAASSFSIGDQSNLTSNRYRNTVLSLNQWDLNRNGVDDLIASWGVVLTNNPPDPNWAPHVTASSTQPAPGDRSVILSAPATDSDQDMLTYSWTDSAESASIPPVPLACWTPHTLGVHTFTVTVDDQHGHTVSSSVTVDFGSGGGGNTPTITVTAPTSGAKVTAGTPYTITWTTNPNGATITGYIVDETFTNMNGTVQNGICTNLPPTATSCTWNDPEPASTTVQITVSAENGSAVIATGTSSNVSIVASGSTLPNGWHHADVGHVGAAGSASLGGTQYDGDQYTVSGSGADIWGTADAFHYAWTVYSGDFEITTRVSSIDDVDAWTKAGIMIRETATNPSSRHASIFGTPGEGVAYQRRLTTGGTSTNTSGSAITAPLWLRMTRVGAKLSAYYRKNPNDNWTLLGADTFTGLPSALAVGLAVTSHKEGTVATAQFAGTWSGVIPSWTATTIGSASGQVTRDDGTNVAIQATGADIWGTEDAFEYRWVPLPGNGMITVRVDSVAEASAWSKAGVMIRESLAPDSKQIDVIVSAAKGIVVQYRATGGASVQPSVVPGTAPAWIRLQRSLNSPNSIDSYMAWYSTDGVTWRSLAVVNGINMTTTSPVYIGLAVTSHTTSASTTAVFDSARIQ